MIKVLYILLISLFFLSPIVAQTKTGNSEVIRMLNAKLPESTIILSIEKSTLPFDTSADALIILSKAGASQNILNEILKKSPDPAPKKSSEPKQAEPPNTKSEIVEGNIASDVSLIENGRKMGMRRITTDIKFGGFKPVDMIPGVGLLKKKRTKFTLPSSKASLRTQNKTPEFEITIPSDSAIQGLVYLLKVKQKKDSRELAYGEASAFGGIKSGFNKDDIISVNITEVGTKKSQSTYRLKPNQPMASGEYVIAVTMAYLYDFGIDVDAQSPDLTQSQKSQKSSTTTGNDVSNDATSNETAEITVKTDVDKLRAIIVQRFTRQNYDLDKDQPSQLVFSKNVGGATGFLVGIIGGKEQSDTRQVITLVITKITNEILITAKAAILYPNNADKRRNVDSKKIRQYLSNELLEIKKACEK